MTTRRSLHRIQAMRQRKRWLRRSWRWLIGDTARGVRFAAGEFRTWLREPTETLP